MNDRDGRDPMDSFERELTDSLRRRADRMPGAPLGFTDVQRRIVQRRRRTATVAAAAVTLPAVVGLGFLAGRSTDDNGITSAEVSAFVGTTVPAAALPFDAATTTVLGEFIPAGSTFRCQGPPVAADDVWQYFGYCEHLQPETTYDPGLIPQTTTSSPAVLPPTTTILAPMTTPQVSVGIDPAALAAEVLVVDASGGVASMSEVASLLGVTPRFAMVATRSVDETMVMPLGADVTAAFALLERFGVGGFDTWAPDLVTGVVPDGVTAVLAVGTDGPLPWRP